MIVASNLNIGPVATQAATPGVTILAVSYPSQRAVRSDDILIYGCTHQSVNTLTPPGGWTSIAALANTTGTLLPYEFLAYKKAAGGETSTFNQTVANNVGSWGMVVAVPDVDLLNVLDAAAVTKDQTTSSPSLVANAVTSIFAYAMFVSMSSGSTISQTATIDSSYTEIGDQPGGIKSGQMAYLIKSAAGASSPTVTWSGSCKSVNILVSLRPAPPRFGLMMAV